MDTKEKLEKIVKALDSKKAEDIEVLGIRDLTVLSDYFVIANGTSTTHTRTLADEVEYQLSQSGIEPSGKEGHNGSNWIVLDYSDIIVHVFYKETREFYQLERLWADGEHLDVEELLK
ncbi:ribosome silencing factor [Ruminococcus sp. HUN007]|uniref:ribosome silencing factor n=1 Tax=Ruminococcus sp. HUN007 TaxID=1514668 RepID=UPI0005D2B1C3|nr:ribosome silencing factor [Ruminococcus sp. HUN007]